MLFNEPKLLKSGLQIVTDVVARPVSVLFNEPKLLKLIDKIAWFVERRVSVLFNEPKLLKFAFDAERLAALIRFQCSSTSRNC